MKELTMILPYYDNPIMLGEQQRQWLKYPEELRARLHVIIVDDGSPKWPALPHVQRRFVGRAALQVPEAGSEMPAATDLGLASFRLYRTQVDVRWNWLFCRNLGVSVATTDWVFMTDIDHVMPAKSLARIFEAELDARKAYRMSRVDAPDFTPYKPHPNTWLMTRKLFDKIGGYDERFSGFYGTDGEFRRRVQDGADEIVILPYVMIRYPREVIPDASTTTYGRKEVQDRTNVRRIVNERADIPGWKTLRLTFPYEQLL